jgi:HD-like signal output (HDOD) protein
MGDLFSDDYRDEVLRARVMARLRDLPLAPTTETEVLAAVQADRASAVQLTAAVVRDAALTAKLLRQANAGRSRPGREVATPREAIILVGFGTVEALAAGSVIATSLDSGAGRTLFEPECFWRHSFAVGLCAQLLAEHRAGVCPRTAFVGGLLHDLGKLVLACCVPAEFDAACEGAAGGRWPLLCCERRELGFDHATAGWWLARQWNLPAALARAIAFHHRFEPRAEDLELLATVHLANVYVRALSRRSPSMGLGFSGDASLPIADSGARSLLGLPANPSEDLTDRLLAELERSDALFGTPQADSRERAEVVA